jgi:hypothetical protein
MACPPELAEVLARIIERGLLRIRVYGWSGQANLCAVEADHIHNLPYLIAHYSPDLLAFYWTIERPCYLEHIPETERACWEPLWDRLSAAADLVAGLGTRR